jgi:hypothetical protein
LQDSFGTGAAAGGDLRNAGIGFVEITGGEMRERVVKGIGMRGALCEGEAESEY